MNTRHRLCILAVVLALVVLVPAGLVAVFQCLRAIGVQSSGAYILGGFVYALAAATVIYGGFWLYTGAREGRARDTQTTATEATK